MLLTALISKIFLVEMAQMIRHRTGKGLIPAKKTEQNKTKNQILKKSKDWNWIRKRNLHLELETFTYKDISPGKELECDATAEFIKDQGRQIQKKETQSQQRVRQKVGRCTNRFQYRKRKGGIVPFLICIN